MPLCSCFCQQEEKTEEKTSASPGGAPATGSAGGKPTVPGGVAKENGVKEVTPTPFGGDGLREPLSIDKRIAETSGYTQMETEQSVIKQ